MQPIVAAPVSFFGATANMYLVWTYAAYIVLTAALAIWVATALHKNGRAFLVDAFHGNEKLADSVNNLLRVGCYLINIGYATLALQYGDKPNTIHGAIEFLSSKIGIALLVVGAIHYLNLLVMSSMRKRALLANEFPPFAPEERV